MSEQRKKYKDMGKKGIENEHIMLLLSYLSDEELDMMLMVARALTENDYDIMPKSALEFFATSSDNETKQKAIAALEKKSA